MNDYTPTIVTFMNEALLLEIHDAQKFDQLRKPIIKNLFPDHALPYDVETLLEALCDETSQSFAVIEEPIAPQPEASTQRAAPTVSESASPPQTGQEPPSPKTKFVWIDAPDLSSPAKPGVREAETSRFLNTLAHKICALSNESTSTPVLRTEFTDYYCANAIGHTAGKTLKNQTMIRKPDVTGIKPFTNGNLYAEAPVDITWLLVRLILELKCGKLENFDFFKMMHVSICNEAYLILAKQINRRFVISLGLHQYHMYLGIICRAGVIYIKCFSITSKVRLFLRILLGILFAEDKYLGYDPTMHINKDGTGTVRVRDRVLRIKREAFRCCTIRGRATTVLICEMEDSTNPGSKITVALKDTWVIEGRRPDEGQLYRKANRKKVQNIPTLIDAWDVEFDGLLDRTSNIPGFAEGFEVRIHRRFIFREYGESLAFFSSKIEFLYALIDALIGA